jgi:hypothetical protein
MSDTIITTIILGAPAILWFFLIIVLLVLFRDTIHEALTSLAWRVKSGASVKIASFELGETYIQPGKGEPKSTKLIFVKTDKNRIRYNERADYYQPNRDLFLVHTISPSKEPNELYDIRIYLIPHKDATLACVQSVEYYFGKYWHDHIFVSTDRSRSFLVSTSAYGPFVCTAEIHFTDGNTTILWRYIDFEMGILGRG